MISRRNRAIRYGSMTKEEEQQLTIKQRIVAYLTVILGAVLYSFGVCWILQVGGFFSGGVTGTSQLIVALVEKFGKNTEIINFIRGSLGTFVLVINVPLLVFGWRGVSKRFVLLTTISIIVQSIVMNILSTNTVSPFIFLMKNGNGLGDGIIDIFKNHLIDISYSETNVALLESFKVNMTPGTRLVLALIGGFVCGIGAAICLKAGGSTGGMDIISNYLYAKKQISFTKYQSIVDTTIICLSSIISVENVLFTLIRLYSYMKAIEMFYKSYRINRIEVVSDKCEELSALLIEKVGHSGTIYDCVGAFSHLTKKTLVIYASYFETNIYINIIKDVDPKAFIAVSNSEIVKSNFIQKTII